MVGMTALEAFHSDYRCIPLNSRLIYNQAKAVVASADYHFIIANIGPI
jgi:hypothetical protein